MVHTFFQSLTENCRFEDLEKRFSSILLVVFNYDRCLEHFLYHALQTYYRVQPSEVSNLLEKLKIIHPYGSVGELEFQSAFKSVPFGQELNAVGLQQMFDSIITFTEVQSDTPSDINSCLVDFRTFDRLVFLGFAFHNLNLELLLPNSIYGTANSGVGKIRCVGTVYGISESDRILVEGKLRGLLGVNTEIKLSHLGCVKLFSEHWRSLSFVD